MLTQHELDADKRYRCLLQVRHHKYVKPCLLVLLADLL